MSTSAEAKLDPNLALKNIFQDPDWLYKTGFGGMANASALLLIFVNPMFLPLTVILVALVYGYLLKVIRCQIINREKALPEWNNPLELLLSGLSWMAVQYSLYFLLAAVVAACLITGSLALPMKEFSHYVFIFWAISEILIVCLYLLIDFLLPFLMVNFALEERISAGFAIGPVLAKVSSNRLNFLLAWLLGIGIRGAAIVLPTLTFFGVFLIPSSFFLSQIISTILAAQVWQRDS